MNSTKTASRYAKALLELAIEKDKLEVVASNMRGIVAAHEETHQFHLFLTSPLIQSSKKIEVLNQIFDYFDELSISFVDLIAKNKREGMLIEIAIAFEEQYKSHLGIIPVTLVASKKLDQETVNKILYKVKPAVKGTILLNEKIDADLLGGFIIKIGNTQIDASVSNQLNNLKQRLTR